MRPIQPLEVGVMFWMGGELGIEGTPSRIVSTLQALGVRCGQLGIDGKADIGVGSRDAWRKALAEWEIAVVTAFTSFTGESYADIPTANKTVGYGPRATRDERERRTCKASDFAKALEIPSVATHIGRIPEMNCQPDYSELLALIRRICDHCKGNGQTFCLETGQEPVSTLNQFLQDVERENLGINFDPANMILYGSGDPLEALEELKHWVITVHCKDGTPPIHSGDLGRETPLGSGAVGLDRFVAKLKEIGYRGPLIIEREILGEAQRRDIMEGILLLKRLL
jgi:L-ribulose-5-phosphate 3-epimerase